MPGPCADQVRSSLAVVLVPGEQVPGDDGQLARHRDGGHPATPTCLDPGMEARERAGRADRGVGGLGQQTPRMGLALAADVSAPCRPIPRLTDPGVETEVAHQLGRSAEAPDVADDREDARRCHEPDAWDGEQTADPRVVDDHRRDGPGDRVDLLAQERIEPECRVECQALVRRQLERGQPATPGDPEGIAHRRAQESARQDGRHPVAGRGAVPHQAGAERHEPTQAPGRLVGYPDLRQVVGGQELGEGGSVDVVGLALGVRDGPRPQRVGHDDPARMSAEELGERPGVRGRLQGHDVLRSQGGRELPECVTHRDTGQPASRALLLHHRDVGEVPSHVEPHVAHRGPPSSVSDSDTRWATRHLRIRARSTTGQVAGAATYTLGLSVQ